MSNIYDVIIIGAGSVGIPIAMELAYSNKKILVLDREASPGQGSNKSAIGGIRATHTDPGKIFLSQESLEIFSSWQQKNGDDIEWYRGGYTFLAYTEAIKQTLLATLDIQKKSGARIDWLEADSLRERIPCLNDQQLLGGTWSPDDGSASPLRASLAFYRKACEAGAIFHFHEPVIAIEHKSGHITGVVTEKNRYHCNYLVNCAGAWSNQIASLTNSELPVRPNAHEAGVTEPIAHFIDPMIVDMRGFADTANFYFYQHKTGQIIFCTTPSDDVWGYDTHETSTFLPVAAQRLLSILPCLDSVKVRRTWRGLYPMTPDGLPLIGWDRQVEGLFIAAGMCGQGFMLGPGVGRLVSRILDGKTTPTDQFILDSHSPYRDFSTTETLN